MRSLGTRNRWGAFSAVAATLLFAASGCGYHFAGASTRLPDDIKTISLGPIQNATREVGIEKELLDALEDEIAGRGRLEVVSAGEGDVVLSGVLRDYNSRPIAFSGKDEALEYQASVAIDLELRRRADGKLLWKSRGLRESEDYSAVPGVVVTSSSQFQQGNLNARDVGRFTDIQLSEGQRREANDRLLESLSKNVYDQMMEDF